MRTLFWIVLAGCLGHLSGCSEFVAPSSQTTSVDVVGEPSDPTPDSMKQADILGSAPAMPDDADLVTDAVEVRGTPKPMPDDLIDPVEEEFQPDIAGGKEFTKPVSLKKKSTSTSSDK